MRTRGRLCGARKDEEGNGLVLGRDRTGGGGSGAVGLLVVLVRFQKHATIFCSSVYVHRVKGSVG